MVSLRPSRWETAIFNCALCFFGACVAFFFGGAKLVFAAISSETINADVFSAFAKFIPELSWRMLLISLSMRCEVREN